MKRQRFVAIAPPATGRRWMGSPIFVATCAIVAAGATSTAHAQIYESPNLNPPVAEDPIQEGRDGMRILGTIPVSPGPVSPGQGSPGQAPPYVQHAPLDSDDGTEGPLSADRMAWSEAAKNAYAAHQYGEARSLYHRAAMGGDAEAQFMLGQMAERGQGGPQDLEEAVGWYAAAARKGVKGASQKVASLTDTLRRQAEENQYARAEPDAKPETPTKSTPTRNTPTKNTSADTGKKAEARKPPARQASRDSGAATPGRSNAGATDSGATGAEASASEARAPAPRAQSSAPARGQKAESLTPRPAPEVTAQAEPLADIDSEPQAKPATPQKPAPQAKLEPQAVPEPQAAPEPPPKPQAQAEPPVKAEAKPQPQAKAQSQAKAEPQSAPSRSQPGRESERSAGPEMSVPTWPAPAAQADAPAAQADASTSRGDPGGSRGATAPTQEASLPESLQAPGQSSGQTPGADGDSMSGLAPAPRRTAPPLSADAKAKLAQARALENGTGVAKNEAKAVELLRGIADQSPEAAFDLGWRYAGGRAVKRDDKEAARYYRMAADMGYAAAQNNLGVLLAEGRGVKRDDEEAVDWYRRAALQDFAPAQVNLALMYGKGRGVAQSDASAMAWYSRAAKSGYGPATASLAMMYSEGRGVPQDQKTADFLMESAKGASPVSGLVSVGP